MNINLKGRSFLTLLDYSKEEIYYLLDLAKALKKAKKAGRVGDLLVGKTIALIFEKTSTRTRCCFEVSCFDEGGRSTFLDPAASQIGKKESIEDTAKVLGRYYDGIEYRGYKQSVVEAFAEHSGIPVWNGLTDVDHPTQILAALLTMEENINKPFNQCKVVFCGDVRNNMAYAWMYGCAKMGIHFVAYGPEALCNEIDAEVLKRARALAEETGAKIEISQDPASLKGADVVYTDIWASMGEESQIPERVKLLTPFKVTKELMAKTENQDTIFLHCLPSFHDFETKMAKEQIDLGYDIREVTDEVFRSSSSKVFEEAENRLHTIKSVIVATLAPEKALRDFIAQWGGEFNA